MNIQFFENVDLDCLLPITLVSAFAPFLCKNEIAVSENYGGLKPWPCNQTTVLKVESDVCLHQETVDPHIIP